MMCRADTVGVFQIESRAQMSMLPRLQPQTFYELVIEIAIVRPGPIQGGMVHPYLRRKQQLEPVRYPHESLKPVLERTLGVPIFQEQVIKLSMIAAGFSGGEADELRRAMASWGKNGNLLVFREKLVNGMLANGYDRSLAEQLFEQMKGFGAYGFPESHSASFALLAYFSAWIKQHHPAAFYCGLLNSQPMGFYAPAQLVYDAQRHHVKVLPIDVRHSHWHHSLEFSPPAPTRPPSSSRRTPGSSPQSPVHPLDTGMRRYDDEGTPNMRLGIRRYDDEGIPNLRLGMRLISALQEATAEIIACTREQSPFTSMEDFHKRAPMHPEQRTALASANAFQGLSQNRQHTTWDTLSQQLDQLAAHSLPAEVSLEDNTYSDYQSTGLTLNEHPIALLRRQHQYRNLIRACDLPSCRDGQPVKILGLTTCRQRPGSASGVMFLTLEDETGVVNVVLWEQVQKRYRAEIKGGNILLVEGRLQISTSPGEQQLSVIHLVGQKLRCLAWEDIQSIRNFH
ncbi:exodeoxyribonuclease VII large subunit [Microbulbifer sp. SH-1]|uniref:exodeoxyribonuclease VII large subunit n=1 Tax=Microbulbifer sp. SH-1 TaxID=2681547 RepID=UPI001F116218|nr:exodeoxyribonuclease VII large subunit [Microbulbifer sp. SH-1]